MEFNEMLARARKTKGLTQSELGNILGVTPQTVSKWENGVAEPDMQTVKKLAAVLEMDVAQYFGGGKTSSDDDKIEIVKTKQSPARWLFYGIFYTLLGVAFLAIAAALGAKGELPVVFPIVFGVVAAPLALTAGIFCLVQYAFYKKTPDKIGEFCCGTLRICEPSVEIKCDDIATVTAHKAYEKWFFKFVGSDVTSRTFGKLAILTKDGKKIRLYNVENVEAVKDKLQGAIVRK